MTGPRVRNLCAKCRAWELKPGDRFCALCKTAQFETLLLYFDRERPEPVSASFPVVNPSGTTGSTLQLAADNTIQLQARELHVAPGERTRVRFTVNPGRLGNILHSEGFITVADGPRVVKEVRVQTHPAPRKVEVGPVELLEGAAEAVLHFETECPVDLEDVEFASEPPLVELSPVQLPVSLVIGQTSVTFHVRRAERGEAILHFRLGTGAAKGSRVFTGTCKAVIRRPPTASFPGGQTQNFAICPDDSATCPLALRNDGDVPLRLRGIRLECPNPEAKWAYESISPDVAPQTEGSVALTIKTTPRARGDIMLDVTLESNDPETRKCRIVASINDTDYTDFIAVDYGTSVSAVARLTPTKAENIKLGREGTGVSSDVFFVASRPELDPPYLFLVGAEARSRGLAAPGRYARAIKPKVGTGFRQHIVLNTGSLDVPAEEIAQLAVMELLRLTRKALQGRPTKLVFTVPTRFSLHQTEALSAAFARAAQVKGIDIGRPEVVNESLAAGTYYLECCARTDPALSGRETYTLMVMDFGGGTADVTLFLVHQKESDGIWCADHVDVLGAWGDQNLGGEALTEKLAGLLKDARADSQPATAEALKLVISEVFKSTGGQKQSGRPGRPTAGQSLIPRDDGLLREQLQILGAVSDAGALPQAELDSKVNEIRNSRRVSAAAEIKNAKPVEVSVDRVLAFGRAWIGGFVKEMRRFLDRVELARADRLLLCGRASLLPVVPEALGDLAEHLDYVRDENGNPILKECVSLGAVIHTAVGGERVQIRREQRLWRMIGVRGRAQGKVGGAFSFKPVVPWGAEYGERFECPIDPNRDVRRDAAGRRRAVELQLFENLSLSDEPHAVPYRTYVLEADDIPAGALQGFIDLTQEGEIRVYCQIGGKLRELKPKSTQGGT